MIRKTKAILNLAFPLTIIIFILFTKWWIADIVDASDGILYGFPLIYKAPAFHTSMAQRYFIFELLVDFVIYFSVILGISFLVNRYLSEIKFKKAISLLIYFIAGVLFSIQILFASVFETSFSIKRDFDIEVKQSGFKFYFSSEERNEYKKLHQ